MQNDRAGPRRSGEGDEWRVRIAKLNIDENPETTRRFNVQSIPMLLVMKAGREVDRIVGVQPKTEIVRRLEQAVA